ncbi:MAG: DUF6155 family protein [Vicingaceae bacterium]
MSKRQLTEFLNDLNKQELKEQVIDLYQRFKDVKEFYDFSFDPKEEERLRLVKTKISREYFPENGRKAKKRRSVAQKHIRKLQQLEADPVIIADIMLYHIEVAQTYTLENTIKQQAFYKSMLTSFQAALAWIDQNGLLPDFQDRIESIIEESKAQEWCNFKGFLLAKEKLIVPKY